MKLDDNLTLEIGSILEEETRYAPAAYQFALMVVSHTVSQNNKSALPPGRRHVRGKQLLEGLCSLTIDLFGPLGAEVLHSWGIYQGEDLGNIIFILIDHKILSASDEDTIEDFKGGINLNVALNKPFVETADWPIDLPIIT